MSDQPKGLKKPLNLSADLEAVTGPGPMSRTDATRKIWDYIKENNLQEPTNRKMINSDDKLKKIFGGESQVHMMQIAKHLSNHVSSTDSAPAAKAA